MRSIRYLSFAMVTAFGADCSAADLTARDSIAESPQTVASERTIGIEGATSIRIRFNSASIARGARIRLIAEDGDTQEFDQAALLRWGLQSAIFNGSSVKIRIDAPLRTSASYDALALKIELKPTTAVTPGVVFGTDERVDIDDPRVGRIAPIGCTGWLTSLGAVLTAGHCEPTGQVLQFNVPPSKADGTSKEPPADDQYPLVSDALDGDSGGIGRDWRIMTILANAAGASAYDRQKAFFRLSRRGAGYRQSSPTPAGDRLRGR